MSLSDQPPKPKGRIHSIFADGRNISDVGRTPSGTFLRTDSGTFVVTTDASGKPQYAFQPADTTANPPKVTIINGVVHLGELPKILDDSDRTQLLDRLAQSVPVTRTPKALSLNPLLIAATAYLFYLGITAIASCLALSFMSPFMSAFLIVAFLAYKAIGHFSNHSRDAIYA